VTATEGLVKSEKVKGYRRGATLMAFSTKPHLKVASAKTKMDQRGGSDGRLQPFTFHQIRPPGCWLL